MKYFFDRVDGIREELSEEECYSQIELNTCLDKAMINILLNSGGIKHPYGRWVKENDRPKK